MLEFIHKIEASIRKEEAESRQLLTMLEELHKAIPFMPTTTVNPTTTTEASILIVESLLKGLLK